ncbi:hypothetical protein CU097_002754, partial [Rhizopus azygosporus]
MYANKINSLENQKYLAVRSIMPSSSASRKSVSKDNLRPLELRLLDSSQSNFNQGLKQELANTTWY